MDSASEQRATYSSSHH